jgi:hypothetical protein
MRTSLMLLLAVSLATVTSTPVAAQKTIKRQVEKNNAYVQPPVKAGDNGHLLRVNFSVPGGNITAVDYNCIGNVCGWVHPCDANFCSGHDVPVELVGNGDAIWWGWSNSGDNCVLDFTIHY